MKQKGWIFPYLKRHAWRLSLAVALGVLGVLSSAMLLFLSGFLISKAALRPENIMLIYVPIVAVRATSISQAVSRYLERLVGHDTVLRILASMRVRLYRILEPQALFIRSRFRTGDMLGVLADDIEHLQDVYLRTVFPAIVSLFVYGLLIIGLGVFDWIFALMMALYVAVILFAVPLVSLIVTRKKHQQAKKGRHQLYEKLTDAVLGIYDWQVSGRKQSFIETYEVDERKLVDIERSVHNWERWRNLLNQLVIGGIVLSMMIWAGNQSSQHEIAVTLIAAFILVVFPVMDAFVPIAMAVEKIPRYQDSLERIENIEQIEEKTSDNHHFPFEQSDWEHVHIKLQDVSYRYGESDHWILKNVSLEIPQGKKVAVLGRSGAGKSTLIKLMHGALLPEQGTVTANEIETHLLDRDISSVISVFNQQPHLFDTTIANNIRLGKPQATDEEIRAAAKQAQLDTLIESLPNGYHTSMHEMGQRFSGGERQRIALARILLQNNPIVILDEPTIGLDPRTENALLSTIFQTLNGKTLLWVTHHLTGVEQMDEILFLEDGKITMSGTHPYLLKNNARYQQLYALDAPFHEI
ncbi:thiol reductant ABC exporter subunit CydC [Bacillus chungangensis]|uniref:ATP-binding cassette subfamily C protein CydC n=1 Tax=Bacillus chungangensis TaxID=587633 RepID=A0ABT9WN63_9BACI|nr:thiol reductant ABC exporter subunit CydC [Bacillus chungangensis]MDQ0174674.1 ATP-binding cassette subfamily C protein CydC [Bacillus chungangensis]